MSNPSDPMNTDPTNTEPINTGPISPEHQSDAVHTGSATRTRTRTNPLRNHRTAVMTGVVALVVGGLIGGGLGYAAADTGSSSTTTSHSTPASGGTHHKAADKHVSKGIAGKISAMNGSTWTVTTRKNEQVTVDIGADTTFGTAAKPEQQSDFAVGDRVAVAGKRSGDKVAARRVVKRESQPAPSGSPTPAAPSAQPS